MSPETSATAATKARFRLYVLGLFRLEREKGPIRLPTRKIESLLAYLVLHLEEHSREKLAALLWGDSPDTEARGSLRKALTLLRRHISSDLVIADRESVQLNPNISLWVDALEFEKIAHSESADNSHKPGIENLKSQRDFQSAIALYRGDLLADFYDDWILTERERLRALYLNTLLQLVQELRTRSEYDRAIGYAQKALATDPANERAHRHLMFCFVATGNRQAALEQYAICERALQEELAVEPAPETTALYHWIKQAPSERKAAEALITNLPIPVSSFVGREREMAHVKGLLSRTRLLTLTGPGGSGKTRLAIQVATDLIDAFKDGVWWVDLAALMDQTLVPQAVARVLGVREIPNQPLTETLFNFLRSKQLLLVWDNCEHLIHACAQLGEFLLSTCPQLKILATSRELLDITGEEVFPMPPLSMPSPHSAWSTENLMGYEAIHLFCERARSVGYGFALQEENARFVVQICQRLDGIPLAIELAAARARALAVEQIASRLDDRFDLLTTGSRTALPRQQTLRATIDWSHGLLSEKERILLRRLAVFAGGWTLEAAEAVCSGEAVQTSQVLDLLTRLVDKSLVILIVHGNPARYRLLDTIHEYAREKLAEANEIDKLRSCHLDYFVELAEKAESELGGPKRLVWFNREEVEFDNLRAAFESSLTVPDGIERGLRLAGALNQFWGWRSHQVEGGRWTERILAASRERGTGSATARAKALRAAGILSWAQTDYSVARQVCEESATLCRQVGDKRGLGHALLWLSVVAHYQGNNREARALNEESVAIFRGMGDKWSLAYALAYLGQITLAGDDETTARFCIQESFTLFKELGDQWTIEVPLAALGIMAYREGKYAESRSFFEKFLVIARELDDQWGTAIITRWSGDVARAEGDYERAASFYEGGLAIWRTLGAKRFIRQTLLGLGQVAIHRGEYDQAANLFSESLDLREEEAGVFEKEGIAFCLAGIAVLCETRGQSQRAARLFGGAEVLLEGIVTPYSYIASRADYNRTAVAMRARLHDAALGNAWAEGRAMTMQQAIELALEPL